MSDLFSIQVLRLPSTEHEYREISDTIRAIWEPFSREIDKVLARRIPRMLVHLDGTIENHWDSETQASIDRMVGMARSEVRSYLQQRGIVL